MINSQTKKIYNKRMFKQITIMGMHKELLPIACPRKDQQEILAKDQQSVRKKGSPQNLREPVIEPQTLKKVIGQYLNLQAKWQDQKFKTLVDNRAIRNHISPVAIKRIGLPYR